VTPSERAVRKASSKRLLADMKWAAGWAKAWMDYPQYSGREVVIWECYLDFARTETSRTRYACLMTAFGM